MLATKKIFRWVIYLLILLLTIMAIAAAIIRFVVFPNIDQYKNTISAKISHKIGLKTTIGEIVTDWDGISPRVLIKEIDLYDKNNVSALHLENVKGTLSWLSIPMMQTHLSNLSVKNPDLKIQRSLNGNIYIAGIALTGKGKPEIANWLLSQEKITVKNASITWDDKVRQTPPLSLNQVNFKLRNPAWRKVFGQHLFTFSALPSAGTKQLITVEGDFFGRDVSQIKKWKGNAILKGQKIDLAIWKTWVDYPIDLQSGTGNADISFSFSNSKIHKLKANILLKNLLGKIDPDKKALKVAQLSGLVTWEKGINATTVNAQNIKLFTEDSPHIDNGSGLISYTIKNGQPWINASANIESFDISFLKKLSGSVSLPDKFDKLINGLAPRGRLNNTSVNWYGSGKQPTKYRFKSRISALSINAYGDIPGFQNLSGEVDANEEYGALDIASKNASLDIKDFLRWPIPAQKLNGKLSWNINKDKLKVLAKDIYIANKHINGTVNASYDMNGIKGGYLDLTGAFENGNIKYAPFYYPTTLNDETIEWLDSSILSGKASNVRLTMKGHLDDFPYVDKQNRLNPKLGLFRVTARLNDAVLEYGKNWPKLNALGLDMLFEGNRMELNADRGKILGLNITKTKAIIPELDTKVSLSQVLNITGEANGPITDGIRFVNSSPVQDVTLGFTDNLKTAGNGKLNIDLSLPLNDIDNSKYKGQYHINDGTMYADDNMGLPEIRHLFGTLSFDKTGINAEKVKAEMLDGPMLLTLNTASDGTINIDANGTANSTGIQKVLKNPITSTLTGTTNWEADIAINKPLVNLNIRSNLTGMEINLPAPLRKSSSIDASLVITKKQIAANSDMFDIAYNNVISAKILRSEKNGHLVIDRGNIGINKPVKFPTEAGLTLKGQLDYLNADEWLALKNKPNQSGQITDLNISSADLSIQKLDIFKRSLGKIDIKAKPNNGHIQLALKSQDLIGDVEWHSTKNNADDGKIVARFDKLYIPSSKEEDASEKDIKRLDSKYPALDIKANDFKLGKKALGALELNAIESNQDWVIKKLVISNPKSTLTAEGTWHNWTRNPNTNLNFTLATDDIGDTLKRFGQADAIKDGVAIISGRLQWAGSPHEFKKDSLNGEFRLGASKGQVVKVKPGVGRLFGLLTLQSLPRRLTLDFKDLFSEGFAFDEISATAKINNGVMRSDDFFMTGPAAETEIKGETNLKTETQDLNVKVVPHISDTLSLAALAGGPLAGAAAWLAQKILKDPLNKIAQSEYRITGTWDKPVEMKSEAQDKKLKENSPLNLQQN